MRELIKWNFQLATKAWQEPDDYGRSYELRTRDKRVVKILRIEENDRYPIVGETTSFWDFRVKETHRWMTDGTYLGSLSPCNMDLQLYIVFRYPGVPIPDEARLSRLPSRKTPTPYHPP